MNYNVGVRSLKPLNTVKQCYLRTIFFNAYLNIGLHGIWSCQYRNAKKFRCKGTSPVPEQGDIVLLRNEEAGRRGKNAVVDA
jgi:hypothetical protein